MSVRLASLGLLVTLAACGGGSDTAATAAAPAPATGVAGAPAAAPAPGTAPAPGGAPAAAPTSAGSSCDNPTGRVLRVGAGQPYLVPSAAAAAAANGDVIRIAAGAYQGDVATWSASNITICGDGGRARLYAAGRNAQGKGIWVITGSNVTLDNLEFHDAKVPDLNGAGVRTEGANLTIRNSGFYNNENGILGGFAGSTITIESSEFARNGHGDGYSHNLYIGAVDHLIVRNSFFHEAKIGHQLKSRARQSTIENSYFMDGPSGTSSYLAEFPNGGVVLLRGNLLHKGPMADNPIAVAYGQEGLSAPVNTLELVHNTIAMTRSGGTFVVARAGASSVKMTANVFAGTGLPALWGGTFPLANVVQLGNVQSPASEIAGAANLTTPNFWPNATLQARLPVALDAAYTQDAPAPYRLRALSGTGRLAGALQSAP
ncbi:MAG: right-handed parallel beta-helix repeat-containing protein [Pseudomonadota bacterium]